MGAPPPHAPPPSSLSLPLSAIDRAPTFSLSSGPTIAMESCMYPWMPASSGFSSSTKATHRRWISWSCKKRTTTTTTTTNKRVNQATAKVKSAAGMRLADPKQARKMTQEIRQRSKLLCLHNAACTYNATQ